MSSQGEFHNFKAFVAEEEDMNTFLKLRTKEKEEPVNKKIQKKVDKDREEKEKVCPRCGHKEGEGCKCSEEDFYSTVNAYRIPRGEQVYVKEMRNLVTFENYITESAKDDPGFSHVYSLPISWWKQWEKKNKNKYQFHEEESYWDVFTKEGVHLLTYNYAEGKVYSDEPEHFFEI
jgi:hypothetical protein